MEAKDLTVVLTLTEEDDKLYSKSIIHKYAKFPFVISRTSGLDKARRECIDRVVSPFILVLDADTVLPESFIDDAYTVMCLNSKVVVVALDYENCQGHYAFGASMWRTEVLKKLYDYNRNNILCECQYMWRKVLSSGYKIETLPYRALHVRGK